MEYEDLCHDKRRDLQGQRSRLQGHVMCLTGVGWYVENELRHRNTKIGRRVAHVPTGNDASKI